MDMSSHKLPLCSPEPSDPCELHGRMQGEPAVDVQDEGGSNAAGRIAPPSGKCVQLTSMHPVFDTRIFVKQCRTLAEAGYDVVLIAAHDRDECVDQVQIRAVPKNASRGRRGLITLPRLFWRALRESGDVYHFHDPELIPIGLLLKLCGKTVVYDVHEDYPRAVLIKRWLPSAIRRLVSVAFSGVELVAGWCFDGVVAVTQTIADRFPAGKTIVVQNYPRLDEFCEIPVRRPYHERDQVVAYVGAISEERGIREMVDALPLVAETRSLRMTVAGEFSERDVKHAVQQKPGWSHVEHLGWCGRTQVQDVLNRARIGLVTLHPTPSYRVCNPVKLYEYMAAGLPVVASDFPMWRQVVSEAECGLLVDPLNAEDIAQAVKWLLDNPLEAERMGQRGHQAVTQQLNWCQEADKLLDMYARFTGGGSGTDAAGDGVHSDRRAA